MNHLLSEGPLLSEKGLLAEAGYHTRLIKSYDPATIAAHRLRLKEWDYYCVCDGEMVLALTIADNRYMGLESVTLLNVKDNWQHTMSFMRLVPMGKTGLPLTSEKGDVRVDGKGYVLDFRNDGETRTLTVHVDDFQKAGPLDATLVLTDAPRDSMVIATPFEKPKAFYYNQKINCLRVSGEVTWKDVRHAFTPDKALAVLDWGRGVWTYHNTWYWSSLSTFVDGVPFGFNLGYGFGNTSQATENMLFYDGKAHKLDQVDFGIPKNEKGEHELMKPWAFTDNEGRLKLTFTPILDRAALTDFKLLKSDQHQVFGRFSGTVTLDDGTSLTLTDAVGFAEKVTNKW